MKYETWEKSSNVATVVVGFYDEHERMAQMAGMALLEGVLDGYSCDISQDDGSLTLRLIYIAYE